MQESQDICCMEQIGQSAPWIHISILLLNSKSRESIVIDSCTRMQKICSKFPKFTLVYGLFLESSNLFIKYSQQKFFHVLFLLVNAQKATHLLN